MNLNNLLVQRGDKLPHVTFDTRSWQGRIPTKSGKFYFSIIAGPHAYCSPREFMEKPNYSEMEVGIFSTETNDWATEQDCQPVFDTIGMGECQYGQAVFPYIETEKILEALELL